MDLKEAKLEKKLTKVANQIKKSRKDKEAAKKEQKQFDEIKRLLESSDEEEIFPDEKENETEFEKPDILPNDPPTLEIFETGKIFSLFDEDTIKCDAFLNSEEKCLIFGRDIASISEEKIRNLIQHGLSENIASDTDKCKSVSLYVFYLLSVHSNAKFREACFKFLKHRRFNISSENVLTVLANYGASVEKLCDSSFDIDVPYQCQSAQEKKNRRFPLLNVKMVAELLINYAKNKQITVDWRSKHLIRALAKIILDSHVRSSGLISKFSTLLSLVAVEAAGVYGSYEVYTWLHLEKASFFEQVEICKNLKPFSPELHHEIILRNIDDILKPKNSVILTSVKIKDIKRILEEIKKKPFDIIVYYCLFQLILLLLPFLDVTAKESKDIGSLLGSIERKIINKTDSTDIVRIKLDIAKMQNLILSKTDSRYVMNESIQLSPVKGALDQHD